MKRGRRAKFKVYLIKVMRHVLLLCYGWYRIATHQVLPIITPHEQIIRLVKLLQSNYCNENVFLCKKRYIQVSILLFELFVERESIQSIRKCLEPQNAFVMSANVRYFRVYRSSTSAVTVSRDARHDASCT